MAKVLKWCDSETAGTDGFITVQTVPVNLMDSISLLDGSCPPHSTICSSHELPECKVDISDLPRIAYAIKTFKRVALQFPDDLLDIATETTHELQHLVKLETNRCDDIGKGPILFILADTACGSCCVDEVAAEHYSAGIL